MGLFLWFLKEFRCISAVGCRPGEIDVYDSLYNSLSSSATRQICCLLHTTQPKIAVRMKNVQSQSGGNDCGLFAIAFAVCLCEGKDLCKFKWSQEHMRSHLCACLTSQAMSLFPGKSSMAPAKVIINTMSIQVSCSCRMPETRNMIKYTKCAVCFHRKCENIQRTTSLSGWQCKKW